MRADDMEAQWNHALSSNKQQHVAAVGCCDKHDLIIPMPTLPHSMRTPVRGVCILLFGPPGDSDYAYGCICGGELS